MQPLNVFCSRRHMMKAIVAASAASMTRGVFAAELSATAQLTEGPFYPDKMPLDTDNDLLVINDSITPAVGEITLLSGRVLSKTGQPMRNAFVEIWQVDNQGAYLHSGTSNREGRDQNFQGYGRFLTDSEGRYFFRTIKPVSYPGRCPHIHFGISKNGQRILTTQLFVAGHPDNGFDGIYNELPAKARESVTADFKPIASSPLNELAANFDIVLGVTAPDRADAPIKGGIGRSQGGGPGGPGGPGGRRGPRPRGPSGPGETGGGPGGPGGPSARRRPRPDDQPLE